MHQLVAAKSDAVWVDVLSIIALVVPLSQLCRLSFSKCGLRLLDSACSAALGTSRPVAGARENGRFPFLVASWALPLSPVSAASQDLLWHLPVLAVIPVLSYVRCYGSK